MQRYIFYCLLVPAVLLSMLLASGCSLVARGIEKGIYESSQPEGTRDGDEGKTFVERLHADTYMLKHTFYQNDYDRETAMQVLNYEATKLAVKKGYSSYQMNGIGQTARESIVMNTVVVRFFKKDDPHIPAGAVAVSKTDLE